MKRPPDWKRFNIWVFLGALVGLGIALLAFVLVHHFLFGGIDFSQFKDSADITPGDIITATATALGGLTIGGVAVMQFRNHKWGEYQAKLEEDTKTGERLSKAIEHLGDSNKYTRIRAIHELVRLAEDSERDRDRIGQILLQFIHGETVHKENFPTEREGVISVVPPEDVQAAIYMLACWENQFDGLQAGVIKDLSGIWLREANLRWGHFDGVRFYGARFHNTHFEGTSFIGADLTAAHFNSAYLENCNFANAELAGTFLEWADLRGADLKEADLHGTHLQGAKLSGADLRGARLDEADLEKVHFDSKTKIGKKYGTQINKHTKFDTGVRMKYFGVEEPEHPRK